MYLFKFLFLSWLFPLSIQNTCPVIFASQVGSVSWGYQQLAVFVTASSDKNIYYTLYDGSLWSQWTCLNVSVSAISGPTVCSSNWGQLDTFYVGTSSDCSTSYHQSYSYKKNGPQWNANWKTIGGGFYSGLFCTSNGNGKLNVFGLGTNSQLYWVTNPNLNSWQKPPY